MGKTEADEGVSRRSPKTKILRLAGALVIGLAVATVIGLTLAAAATSLTDQKNILGFFLVGSLVVGKDIAETVKKRLQPDPTLAREPPGVFSLLALLGGVLLLTWLFPASIALFRTKDAAQTLKGLRIFVLLASVSATGLLGFYYRRKFESGFEAIMFVSGVVLFPLAVFDAILSYLA